MIVKTIPLALTNEKKNNSNCYVRAATYDIRFEFTQMNKQARKIFTPIHNVYIPT